MARREWLRLHFEYRDGDFSLMEVARAVRPLRASRRPPSPLTLTVVGSEGRAGAAASAQADTCCVSDNGAGHDHLRYAFEVMALPTDHVRLTYPGFDQVYRLETFDRTGVARRGPAVLEAHTAEVTAVAASGDTWIVVVLANGFTEDGMAPFLDQVRRLDTALKATPPFNRFSSRVHVVPVRTPSPRNGLDEDSAFGHSEEELGPNWFRFFVDQDAVARFMRRYGFTHHRFQPLVVANTDRYGGSGGAAAVFSLAPEATEIAIHEIGHSEFGLSDEYSAEITNPHLHPFGPNVQKIIGGGFDGLKWRRFATAGAPLPSLGQPVSLDPDAPGLNPSLASVVGAFEGGLYQKRGVYRPQLRCAMRSSSEPFCAVCSDVIGQRLSELTGSPWP